MQQIQSINQTVTQGAIEMYAPRAGNPLCIRVPDDDETSSVPCSSCGGTPNSPWPQLDQYTPVSCPPPPSPEDDARAAFERASAALTKPSPVGIDFPRGRMEKEAPSKFLYSSKRNKNRMPDKRSAAGKACIKNSERRSQSSPSQGVEPPQFPEKIKNQDRKEKMSQWGIFLFLL